MFKITLAKLPAYFTNVSEYTTADGNSSFEEHLVSESLDL